MATRIGFMVDATCNLPEHILTSEGVHILPVGVQIGAHRITDKGRQDVALRFLETDVGRHWQDAETHALDVDTINALFLSNLVTRYDHVFCLTATGTHSLIHDHATRASYRTQQEYQPVRRAAGDLSPFLLRVLDTGSLFAGQGIPLLAGLQRRRVDDTPAAIRSRLDGVIDRTHAYVVLPTLGYLRKRVSKKGEYSVGPLGSWLGGALDLKPILHCHQGKTGAVNRVRGFHAATERLLVAMAMAVRDGLDMPHVNLSFGGTLEALQSLPGYRLLASTCEECNVTLHASVMSLTGIINLGPGALSVGFAGDRPLALD